MLIQLEVPDEPAENSVVLARDHAWQRRGTSWHPASGSGISWRELMAAQQQVELIHDGERGSAPGSTGDAS